MTQQVTVEKLFRLEGHTGPVYALCHGPDGKFFSGGSDRIISLWEAKPNAEGKAVAQTVAAIFSLRYFPEKNVVMAGTSEGGLHIIELNEGRQSHYFKAHASGIFDIAGTSPIDQFFTAGADGNLGIWSGGDFSLIRMISLNAGKIRQLSVHPSGAFIAAACGDGTIRLIDIADMTEQLVIHAHSMACNAVCFSPDGNMLYSGGKDAHLKLWDVHTGMELLSIPAHNYAIYSVLVSPDKKLLATASRDKTIKLWEAAGNNFLVRMDKEKSDAHTHSVNSLLWMKNPEILISTGDDKKIFGWDIKFLNNH